MTTQARAFSDSIFVLGSLKEAIPDGWFQRPITHYVFWRSGESVRAVSIVGEYLSSADANTAAATPLQVNVRTTSVRADELWLWQTPDALGPVMRGIEQARRGEVQDWGSFEGYVDA